VRSSTTAPNAQSQIALNLAVIQDAEIAKIYWDGIADRDALPEPARRRFDTLISPQFNTVNQVYEFAREGTGNRRVWEQQLGGMRWALQQPGIRQWWREWGAATCEEEFRDCVDGLIREGEAAG
jgi:hypothetical protein